MKRAILAPLTALTLIGGASAASAVSVTLTDIMTQDGDTLVYAFTGLPTAATGPGTLTIATIDDGSVFIGIDLGTASNEYMDVDFGGTSLGRFACGTETPGGTLIPGATGANDCQFTLPLTIAPSLLNAAIADGAVTVSLIMGPGVAHFDDLDQVDVTLSYAEAAVVPLPASALLLLAGLGGLAALRRRT